MTNDTLQPSQQPEERSTLDWNGLLHVRSFVRIYSATTAFSEVTQRHLLLLEALVACSRALPSLRGLLRLLLQCGILLFQSGVLLLQSSILHLQCRQAISQQVAQDHPPCHLKLAGCSAHFLHLLPRKHSLLAQRDETLQS